MNLCHSMEWFFLTNIGKHLLGVSFITSLHQIHPQLYLHRTAQKIIAHAQNTTAFKPNVFLTGIHLALFKSKGRSVLPKRSLLPGSTANSTVSNIRFIITTSGVRNCACKSTRWIFQVMINKYNRENISIGIHIINPSKKCNNNP